MHLEKTSKLELYASHQIPSGIIHWRLAVPEALSIGNIPQGTPVLAEGFCLLTRHFTNKTKQNKTCKRSTSKIYENTKAFHIGKRIEMESRL
jgi:hypothetical protein